MDGPLPMHEPSTFLVPSLLFSYLSTYIWDLLITEYVTQVKPDVNSAEVHPQLSHYGHKADLTNVKGASEVPDFKLGQVLKTVGRLGSLRLSFQWSEGISPNSILTELTSQCLKVHYSGPVQSTWVT